MITKEQLELLVMHKDILYIYEFESAIEKQFIADSDSEYIIVVRDGFEDYDIVLPTRTTVYPMNRWFGIIERGDLLCFKCRSLKPKYIHKEYVYLTPKLDVLNLRGQILAICASAQINSQLEFEAGNYAKGKRELYEAFQAVLWGIQIMINKKIVHLDIPDDYFLNIILNPDNDYTYYESNYLNKLNDLLAEFKTYSENEYQEFRQKQIIEQNENNNIQGTE